MAHSLLWWQNGYGLVWVGDNVTPCCEALQILTRYIWHVQVPTTTIGKKQDPKSQTGNPIYERIARQQSATQISMFAERMKHHKVENGNTHDQNRKLRHLYEYTHPKAKQTNNKQTRKGTLAESINTPTPQSQNIIHLFAFTRIVPSIFSRILS